MEHTHPHFVSIFVKRSEAEDVDHLFGMAEEEELCFGTRLVSAPGLSRLIAAEDAREAKDSRNYAPPQLVVDYLEQNGIRRLKKRSARFPRAAYFCALCEYHCTTLLVCVSHAKAARHQQLAKMGQVAKTLQLLPEPTPRHIEALDKFLDDNRRTFGLNEAETKLRLNLTSEIAEVLREDGKGGTTHLLGSSLSGLGLMSSSVDLGLEPPSDTKPHLALIRAYECINGWSEATNVKKDFDSGSPCIQFRFRDRHCILSLFNHLSKQTALLLKDYSTLDSRVTEMSTTIRKWAKIVQIDSQDLGMVSPHTFDIMLVFFLQCTTPPVLPVIHELEKQSHEECYTSPTEKLRHWKSSNRQSSGQLLVNFFAFYAHRFPSSEQVVSIRVKGGLSKEQKKWLGSKLSIEDPFVTKRSLTRNIQGASNFDYFLSCFKLALLYFGTIQTAKGPVITRIKDRNDDKGLEELLRQQMQQPNKPQDDENLKKQLEGLDFEDARVKVEDDSNNDEVLDPLFQSGPYALLLSKYGTELSSKQAIFASNLVPTGAIFFSMDKQALTASMKLTEYCIACNTEGHQSVSCPDLIVPPKTTLHPMSTNYKAHFENALRSVWYMRQPLEAELTHRDFVVKTLLKFIKLTYPSAKLTVFGSSCNGFSFSNSDLDLSLTFDEHETAQSLDCVDIIEGLAKSLHKMRNLRDVTAITTAKVPIVKFVFLKERCPPVMGDISLYNVLAQENTRMLRCYAAIDQRARVLGYLVKHFVKLCDIGDASRGTLSSYAYILMVIHFLQQRQPPILPVLQALHQGDKRPEKMVEGWNAWFFDAIEKLPFQWPYLGQNHESLNDLWLEFLQYYAYDFNSQDDVVTIRQVGKLSKFEKMWNSASFAIEDPFNLSHNLAGGLSKQMFAFIKRTFVVARNRFGTEPHVNDVHSSLFDYLWDKNYLSVGPMPSDRGCRGCGRLGHLVRDCPRNKQNEAKLKQARAKNALKEKSYSENHKSAELTKKAPTQETKVALNSASNSTVPNGLKAAERTSQQASQPPHSLPDRVPETSLRSPNQLIGQLNHRAPPQTSQPHDIPHGLSRRLNGHPQAPHPQAQTHNMGAPHRQTKSRKEQPHRPDKQQKFNGQLHQVNRALHARQVPAQNPIDASPAGSCTSSTDTGKSELKKQGGRNPQKQRALAKAHFAQGRLPSALGSSSAQTVVGKQGRKTPSKNKSVLVKDSHEPHGQGSLPLASSSSSAETGNKGVNKRSRRRRTKYHRALSMVNQASTSLAPAIKEDAAGLHGKDA